MPTYQHIVLISLDTLRSDVVRANPWKAWPGKYDISDRWDTPDLDCLAERGAFFTDCIAAAPYTSAAHGSILSGMWPRKHGCHEFFNGRLAVDTLFTFARRSGMRTLLKVDFPIILGSYLGFDRDIDKFLIEDDDAFLTHLDPSRPTVAMAHFGGIHIPYGFHNRKLGGEHYAKKLAEMERGIPSTSASVADTLVETYRDTDDFAMMVRYKRVIQHHYSRQHYSELFQLYLEGATHFLEHRFRRFLRALEERMKGTKWLLVVFGDHGEEYDENSYGHHNSVSHGVLRVPLIIVGTGVVPGIRRDRIRSIDILPTLIDGMAPGFCSDEDRRALDGVSLADSVWGDSRYPVRDALAQVYTSDTQEFVNYQQGLLRGESRPGELKHVLYKEAAYLSRWRLTRRHYRYVEHGGISGLRRCDSTEQFEEIKGAETVEADLDAGMRTRLRTLLDDYGRIPTKVAGNQGDSIELSSELGDQLRSLGYRIKDDHV